MSEKIDLVVENLKTIQSLIATEQSRLIKEEHYGGGPAYYRACDNVGQKCIRPTIGGPELASWVGKLSAANARDGKINTAPEAKHNRRIMRHILPPTADYSVKIVDDIAPPVEVGSRGEHGVWREAWDIARDLPIGKTVGIRVADQYAAARCQTSLNTYSKRTLRCIENGWRLRTKVDLDHPGVLWMTKVKIG